MHVLTLQGACKCVYMLSVYVRVGGCTCVYVCVWVFVYMRLCMIVHGSLCVHVYVCTCVRVCVRAKRVRARVPARMFSSVMRVREIIDSSSSIAQYVLSCCYCFSFTACSLYVFLFTIVLLNVVGK